MNWLMKLVISVPNLPPYIIFGTDEHNLIVVADSEGKAREIADEREPYFDMIDIRIQHPWLSKEHSICMRLNDN